MLSKSHTKKVWDFFCLQSIYYLGDNMLSVVIKNIKIGVSFSFFAVVGLVCLWQDSNGDKLLLMLMCCLLHEMGHLIAMCLCNVPPIMIIAYGGGIKIYPDNAKMTSDFQDIIILSAGCIINIILACLLFLLNKSPTYFSMANLFLGLFNLMPVKYFDGGRLLSIALKDSKAVNVIRCIFITFFAIVIGAMALKGMFSISLFVIFAYIIISELFA